MSIRNVRAYSNHRFLIRLLAIECKIWNVVIDGVIDTSPEDVVYRGILLGDKDIAYGKNNPDGIRNLTVSNVIYNSTRYAVHVKAFVKDASFTNIISTRSTEPLILVDRENGLVNTNFNNLVALPGVPTVQHL